MLSWSKHLYRFVAKIQAKRERCCDQLRRTFGV